MNSKEALKELKNNFGLGVIGRSLCEIIEQDLEQLEKYKSVIKIINDALELYAAGDEIGVENRSSFIDYEDSELLKEVLGYE